MYLDGCDMDGLPDMLVCHDSAVGGSRANLGKKHKYPSDSTSDGTMRSLRKLMGIRGSALVDFGRELATIFPEALVPVALDPVVAPPPEGWAHLPPPPPPLLVPPPPPPSTTSSTTPESLLPECILRFCSSPESKKLAAKALKNMQVACQLCAPSLSNDDYTAGPPVIEPSIYVSRDIDFGIQTVVQATPRQTNTSTPQGVLDAMVECTSETKSVLLSQLTIEQGGGRGSTWCHVIGGAALPQFPSTFAACDSHGLFWADTPGLTLGAGHSHSISVAMCRWEGEGRDQELGVLQQAVLLFVAVPQGHAMHAALPLIRGAAYVDVIDVSNYAYHQSPPHHTVVYALSKEKMSQMGGNPPIASISYQLTPGTTTATTNMPPHYRIFVCARRVSAVLLRPAQLQSSFELRAEAKQFIPPRLRTLFDNEDAQLHVYCFSPEEGRATMSAILGVREEDMVQPARQKLKAHAVHQQRKGTPPLSLSYIHATLCRYDRLLLVEEEAMSENIRRYDQFSCRLTVALFGTSFNNNNHGYLRKYKKLRIRCIHDRDFDHNQDHDTNSSTFMYRGPRVDYILPQQYCDTHTDKDNSLFALAMITVPGLPESRPALSIGDCAYIRASLAEDYEFIGVVASAEGSTVFIALPPSFWTFTGIEMPLPSGERDKGKVVQSPWFDGLVHVRFSTNSASFAHMREALVAYASTLEGNPESKEGWGCALIPPSPLQKEWMRECVAMCAKTLPTISTVTNTLTAITSTSTTHSNIRVEHKIGISDLNAEQQRAVAAVVAGAGRTVPFAVFGPPVTGKSATIVAMAVQILQTYGRRARLLCCAPQNYSADLLCTALASAGLSPSQMFRLNDPRRPPFSAKSDVIPYCLLDDRLGMFAVPSPATLSSYPVIVCTCAAAALLRPEAGNDIASSNSNSSSKITHTFFTHVLIDEGGQALLPEALVPLTLLRPPLFNRLDPGWGAVVVGDPRQLGPIVHSPAASEAGLGTSLLERLIAFHQASAPTLTTSHHHPGTVTLLHNYRSHASLLDLPSKLFYKNELIASADAASVRPPPWKEVLLNNNSNETGTQEKEEEQIDAMSASAAVSMLYYGVLGSQDRDGDAPSYHNPLEAATVADLVQGILTSPTARVQAREIGVLATYRRQVQSIRLLLRQRGLGSVRVGTVDDYQGQEARIVFISTTLSKPSSLRSASFASTTSTDSTNPLSLWNNPRRFNVAITRAKALLVVVGHPAVLLEDPLWRELLRQCSSRGACRGAGARLLRERTPMVYSGDNDGTDTDDDDDPFNMRGIGSDIKRKQQEHEDNDEELAATIDQIAALALLGTGNLASMFPETLDEMHEAYEKETQWRVMM